MVLVLDEVDILQRSATANSTFDLSAELATFEVVDSCHVILVVKAKRVAHHNKVHFLVILHFNCVDSIDT